MPSLVVFVDSLPYRSLGDCRHLNRLPHRSRVRPGAGYSINVKAELFGGYRPEEVGYFCEWMYRPPSPLHGYRHLFGMLAPFSRVYFLDRVIHRTLSRLLRMPLFNIPFDRLHWFTRSGVAAYEESFPLSTVLTRAPGLRKVLYSRFRSGPGRDRAVMAEACRIAGEEKFDNLFVALADLDHVTHRVGVGTPPHRVKVAEIDGGLARLVDLFLSRFPDGELVIFSDHGMANVTRLVSPEVERRFGRPRPGRYVIFVDSTMLRIWTFEGALRQEMELYLAEGGEGVVLDEGERKEMGLGSSRLGDIIFVLNEGAIFVPSYFGRRRLRAMHGYHPELASQEGVLLSNQPVAGELLNTLEVHRMLERVLHCPPAAESSLPAEGA